MLHSRIIRVGLALTITVLAAGVLSSTAGGAVSATPPRIVAKPNDLMINTKTTLTGTGFPAKTRLTIKGMPEYGLDRSSEPVREEQLHLRADGRTR